MVRCFECNISRLVSPEYVPLVRHLLYLATILFVYQLLNLVSNPEVTVFFSEAFVILFLTLASGICTYWLVVQKMVRVC